MKRIASYVTFEEIPNLGKKTTRWNVIATKDGEPLGEIRWFGRWRQYAFFPADRTIWNPDCLDAVNTKVRSLMEREESMKSPSLPAPRPIKPAMPTYADGFVGIRRHRGLCGTESSSGRRDDANRPNLRPRQLRPTDPPYR